MRSLLLIFLASFIYVEGARDTVNDNNLINSEPVMIMDNKTYPAKLIHVSIDKPAEEVYRFASDPENFPKWVAFVKSIKKDGKYWVAETSIGDIRIKFAPRNEFGIIDHQVTLANGEKVLNPMRVLPNNEGCEFIFTLFRMPGRSDKEYNEDADAVAKDLDKLKEVMESM